MIDAPIIYPAPTRLERLKHRRRRWLQVHLWLGLTIGLVLAIAGLTGSILVFWQEIDAWLNPHLRETKPLDAEHRTYRSLDEIVAAAKSAFPPGTRPGLAEFERNGPDSAVMFFGRDMSKPPAQTDIYNVFVDPYTAAVQGVRMFYDAHDPLRHSLLGFVFKLHYALLMKDTARAAVGWISAVLLISVLTGLILWWPLTGKWRKALTIKRRASTERLVFDWHKTVGFYTAAVLGAVLLSGVYLNLPDQFLSVVRVFSPTTRADTPASFPAEDASPLSVDQAVAAARAKFPGGRLQAVTLPVVANGVYRVCFDDMPDLQEHWISARCVAVDQYSARILGVQDAATGTAGDAFLLWQWYLHSGQAFGMSGRLLIFLAGLACPLLYVTGVIRWAQKRRTRMKRPG